MRALLWLILCLTIPVQGVAAAHAFKAPCPMETGMKAQSSHTMVMADDDSGDDDCCNDAVTVAKTGQLCKAGQECPAGGLGILIQPAAEVSPRITARAFSVPPLFIHTFDPSSVWRPPALA